MRKQALVILANFSVFAIIFAAWSFHCRSEYSRLVPPDSASYRLFLATMPNNPVRHATFESSGDSFVIATGALPSGLILPSGPPLYVFDSDGVLVDWTADSGDDPAFFTRWPSAESARAITQAEAFSLFGKSIGPARN